MPALVICTLSFVILRCPPKAGLEGCTARAVALRGSLRSHLRVTENTPSIAGITARPALAKAQRSHYVQAKSSLDDPPPPAVGTEAISL